VQRCGPSACNCADAQEPVSAWVQRDEGRDRCVPSTRTAPAQRLLTHALGVADGGSARRLILGLHRSLGNAAVQRLFGRDVQRDAGGAGAPPATTADPNDLTGTPFKSLDERLRRKLADTGFRGGDTLAKALGALSNEAINAMARVGAMLSATDPAVWDLVARIKGAWVTDNWGMGVVWTDEKAVTDHCQPDNTWCKDSPLNPMHETHNAWRRVTRGGGPGLHLILDNSGGTSDIHVDAHQPVEGKNKDGSCDMPIGDTITHMLEVGLAHGGGLAGARDTPVGQYSWAQAQAANPPANVGPKAAQGARAELDAIANVVTTYAAMGRLVDGRLSEGDKAMAADAATMAHLNRALDLLIPPPPQIEGPFPF
jgi:hypothetical protein